MVDARVVQKNSKKIDFLNPTPNVSILSQYRALGAKDHFIITNNVLVLKKSFKKIVILASIVG